MFSESGLTRKWDMQIQRNILLRVCIFSDDHRGNTHCQVQLVLIRKKNPKRKFHVFPVMCNTIRISFLAQSDAST